MRPEGRFRGFRIAGRRSKAFSVGEDFPMSTPAIPPGYHSLQSYFTVRDTARAITFYRDLFGAEEIVRMLMPDGKTVMHAEVKIGDSVLMLSEENLEWGTKSPLAERTLIDSRSDGVRRPSAAACTITDARRCRAKAATTASISPA